MLWESENMLFFIRKFGGRLQTFQLNAQWIHYMFFFCLSSRSEFNGCVIDWGFVYSFLSKQFLILLKAAISEESVISSHRHWIESTTPDFSCRPWLCLMTGLCQLICLLFVMLLAWRLAKCWSDVIDINSQHIFRSLTKFARKHRIVELSRM